MFLVGLLQWWYGRGWASQATLFKEHLSQTAAFFSIGQLAATLFAPFRQISAGRSSGSLPDELRALLDTTLSRVIGAIVRSGTIIIGIIVLAVRAAVEGLALCLWFLVPLLPLVGCVLLAIGWAPRWI